MPIRIPDGLPATQTLKEERIDIMDEARASSQDIRPLEIGVLNLMPLKIPTETQFARLLGGTPLQVNLTLIELSTYRGKNTAPEHLEAFYKGFDRIEREGQRFDGLIITGAPVETMEFEDVQYWPELTRIMDWAKSNVYSTFNVCWGAQAALWHDYKVPKYELPEKRFGVFAHQNLALTHPLMRGVADTLDIPVSRHTENVQSDLDQVKDLVTLASSPVSGPAILSDQANRNFYCFNHLEYSTDTLAGEYQRDMEKGKPIHEPENYFDADGKPMNSWRSHASMIFLNWLTWTYQGTPFDLKDL